MHLFIAAFQGVPDPRAENVRHDLVDLLIIAFIAVLCGAQNCSEIAEFGREKHKLFKRFLKLRHGIPSHDTFSTVLRLSMRRRSMRRSARSPRGSVAALGQGRRDRH